MIKLPASLERRLKEIFPRARERDKFVAELVEKELDSNNFTAGDSPEFVGGALHLYTDGGSRGNPGQAAVGCILEDPASGELLREHCDRIGIETNNVAEYRALIDGLKIAKRYHPNSLVCHLDSELVVRQLNGEYKVKMPSLQPLVQEIVELQEEFANVTFVHIPREDNHRADALVNKALDELPDPPYEK